MKATIHPLFAALFVVLSLSQAAKAQTETQAGDPIAYGQTVPGYDLLSELSEDYKSSGSVKTKKNTDLEIKASRIHVDLNNEQEVEFSARTGWAKDFLWKFGDGKSLSGFQHVKHKFDKAGTYQVTLLASNEEETVKKTVEIVVVDSRQPLELEEMEHYIVFPHDNRLEADIQLRLPKREKKLVFQVQDVEGQQVFEYSLGRVRKNEQVRVDLKNLPDGKYYAVLKGKKYSLVSRLTVMR
jgi:PKD repeat protein